MFTRDPVNLIRLFYLAQKHNLVLHPEAMRAAARSLKLIDKHVREDKEANRLFLEILTSNNAAEIVLRRMNETGVLGAFVHSFGRIVAMMQFNMYHHYTVDEHLVRCIGVLNEIERGDRPEFGLANELIKTIQPRASHRAVASRCSCTISPRGASRITRSPGRASRAGCVRGSGSARRRPSSPPGWSRCIWSCRPWRSRAICPTARRSSISPRWRSRWSD